MVELKGRKTGSQHQLYWKNASETGIIKYIIERRVKGQNSYQEIGQVAINTEGYYEWNDQSPAPGINYYRLKMVYPAKFEYSNMIQLKSAAHLVSIYPNPVKQELHISFSSQIVSSYRIEIISASGQAIIRNEVRNISTTTLTYSRNGNIQPGIYLVRITDLETGAVEIHKILYE
jgi:hypothetical protein